MKNDDLDLASITRALTDIKTSIEVSPEDDPNEDCVVQAVQRYRSMLLDYATIAYLNKPKDSKLLEGVTTLVGQLEKSIRDNRKEKSKDKENPSTYGAYLARRYQEGDKSICDEYSLWLNCQLSHEIANDNSGYCVLQIANGNS